MSAKLLLIEPNKTEHDNIYNLLLELKHSRKEIVSCSQLREAFTIPEGQILAILVAASLPGTDAVSTMSALQSRLPFTPVIVLSDGSNDDCLSAVHMGAQDCLSKSDLTAIALGKSIQYAVERKRLLNELTRSHSEYRDIFNNTPCAMCIFDAQTLQFLDVNEAAQKIYGYTREEFLQKTIRDIRAHEDLEGLHKIMSRQHQIGLNDTGIWRHVKKDGSIIYVRVYTHLTHFQDREARATVLIPVD